MIGGCAGEEQSQAYTNSLNEFAVSWKIVCWPFLRGKTCDKCRFPPDWKSIPASASICNRLVASCQESLQAGFRRTDGS